MKYDYVITISISGKVDARDYKEAAQKANQISLDIQDELGDVELRCETDVLIPVHYWILDDDEMPPENIFVE